VCVRLNAKNVGTGHRNGERPATTRMTLIAGRHGEPTLGKPTDEKSPYHIPGEDHSGRNVVLERATLWNDSVLGLVRIQRISGNSASFPVLRASNLRSRGESNENRAQSRASPRSLVNFAVPSALAAERPPS
jgi:hypothetical protein